MRETGQRLKAYAKRKGIVLKWVADKIGITSVSLYYKIEGKSPFTMENSIRIRNICHMTPAEFKAIFCEEEWFTLIES